MTIKAMMTIGVGGLILCLVGLVLAAEGPVRMVASISGTYVRAIQTALPELSAKNLDLTRYQVNVAETATALIVLFQSPNRKQGVIGDAGDDQPEFEVEIDKRTNQIVRSSYAR